MEKLSNILTTSSLLPSKGVKQTNDFCSFKVKLTAFVDFSVIEFVTRE